MRSHRGVRKTGNCHTDHGWSCVRRMHELSVCHDDEPPELTEVRRFEDRPAYRNDGLRHFQTTFRKIKEEDKRE